MKKSARGGFTFLYVFIKSKNTSEKMKLLFSFSLTLFPQLFSYEAHGANKRDHKKS